MRPKLNIKPYNIFEAYQQRYKEPINPGSVPANYTFTGEQLGIEEPVKQQQPVAAPRQTEPKVSGALSGFFSGLTGRRREWPGSANAGRSGAIGYLGSMYTSPEEEERYLRQSQNKTKLMAVGDALRQFGNIYYTSRYATPQKFNDIYAQERARYLQDKAIRDRNNVYYAQQKQREAQLEMQREKIAADAERRNEELAMKREAHKARLPYYTNQAKAAEAAAKIKELEANSKPDELKQKSDKRQADIENVNARTAATKQGAADRHANTMDQIRKRGYTGSYNTNSSKGSDYTSSAWSTKSDGSRWRGKQNKSDISIQEYKNKDRWYITKDEWNSNYARINEILSRNPNSAAAKALANATNETERKAIAQRYATSTKDSYDYMRNLAHGYVPGKKAYASKESKPAGKKKVDMSADRKKALNKLQGAKV
jgi:hypothetical protein